MNETVSSRKRRRAERVSAACDFCKVRKVKCDGSLPCNYCKRKNRSDNCNFSGPKQRRHTSQQASSASKTPANSVGQIPESIGRSTDRPCSDPSRFQQPTEVSTADSPSPAVGRDDHNEDTAVPREARLLRDAQGKLIFIGDCAPLSFLQTVRHLVASKVDANAFPIPASRDSILEIAKPPLETVTQSTLPRVQPSEVTVLIEAYFVATRGLVDLFDKKQISEDLYTWSRDVEPQSKDPVRSAVHHLTVAIAVQETDEAKAEAWFNHAKEMLQVHMCSNTTVSVVQGFTLVAIYLLRAFQPNGAYLFFSLAARAGYAIGLHRTEVNASSGESMLILRDRIWKSLRIVDMFISNVMGRPPSTSDVDCTVKYNVSDFSPNTSHLLDASVQIFMIIERVVVEVYSRKRISLRIASYVSHQLKGWAANWLKQFMTLVTGSTRSVDQDLLVGACSTCCCYFYGIVLLSRPFLMYDLYEYLGASMRATSTRAENQEKRKYSDAALDAAVAFVDMLKTIIDANRMPRRMPLIVSWLFTTSLVLAVGILGRSSLAFENDCETAIRCLDHFAAVDPHARQYSIIVQALLKTTTEHVRKREQHHRSQRKQASTQLFGLLSTEVDPKEIAVDLGYTASAEANMPPINLNDRPQPANDASDWTFYDADFFALPWVNENDIGLQDFLQPGRQTLEGSLADIPLFPMYNHQMSFDSGDGTGI